MVFISNIPHKKRLYNLIFIKIIKTPCLIYGFKNKDVQGLKTKTSWMIENYDTALAKAQKTAEYIQENFSWNKIANQIQELYKQCIKVSFYCFY